MAQSAIKGYSRIWALECKGGGFANGPGKSTELKIRAEKLNGHNWFKKASTSSTNLRKSRHKKKKKEAEIETILFCPFTPG